MRSDRGTDARDDPVTGQVTREHLTIARGSAIVRLHMNAARLSPRRRIPEKIFARIIAFARNAPSKILSELTSNFSIKFFNKFAELELASAELNSSSTRTNLI